MTSNVTAVVVVVVGMAAGVAVWALARDTRLDFAGLVGGVALASASLAVACSIASNADE